MKSDRETGPGFLSSVPQFLLKILLSPSTVVFIPVLFVYAFVKSWQEALAVFAAVIILLILSAAAGAGSHAAFSKIRKEAGLEDADPLPAVFSPSGFYENLSFALSVILTVFSAVALIVCLLTKNFDVGVFLGIFLSALAIGTCFSGLHIGYLFDLISSVAASRIANRKSGGKPVYLTDRNSAGHVTESSGSLILSQEVLFDSRREIRTVWYSGTVFSGESLTDGILKKPAENALLLSAAYSNSDGYPAGLRRLSSALDRFASGAGADEDRLISDIADLKQLNDHPVAGAVTLRLTRMSDLSGTLVLSGIPSADFSRCTSYRDSDGRILPLTDALRTSLSSFFRKASELALTPFIITSIVNEKGRISDLTVLESAYTTGGWFPEMNREADAALSDFGFSDLLLLEKADRSSVSFAVNSGLVTDRNSIMFAGSHATGDEIAVDLPSGRVKVVIGSGFTLPESVSGNILPVGANGTEGLPGGIPDSRPSVALGISGKPAVVPGLCAGVISPADSVTGDGGLMSLFELVSTCSEITLKQLVFSFCLAFSLAVSFFSFFIPFLTMNTAIIPHPLVQIISGFFSLAVSSVVLSSDRPVLFGSVRGLCRASLTRLLLGGLASGFLTASAVAIAGLLAPSVSDRSFYLLPAMTLSSVAAVIAIRISANRHFGYQGPGILPFVFISLSLILSLMLPGVIPGAFGSAPPEAGALILSVAVSLIPSSASFAITLAAAHFIFGRSAADMRRGRRKN